MRFKVQAFNLKRGKKRKKKKKKQTGGEKVVHQWNVWGIPWGKKRKKKKKKLKRRKER